MSEDTKTEGAGSAPGPEERAAEPADSIVSVFSRLGPAAWLATLWTFGPAIMGTTLLLRIEPISAWFRDLGDMGPLVYAAMFIFAAGIGVLPTYSQAILGGWAFGFWIGLPAALIGFVGGSLIGYFIARRVGAARVEAELHRHPKWEAVRDALVRSGTVRTLGIVTLVRIPPNSPFSLTNMLLSTSGVPLWIYVTGTAVGMLPRTAVVVWLASQIQGALTADAIKEARPGWLIASSVVTAVVIFTILYQIGKHALKKVTAGIGEPGTIDR